MFAMVAAAASPKTTRSRHRRRHRPPRAHGSLAKLRSITPPGRSQPFTCTWDFVIRNDYNLLGVDLKEFWTTMVPLPRRFLRPSSVAHDGAPFRYILDHQGAQVTLA